MLGDTITSDGYGETYNEVFDPLNWMFDGLVDFPFNMSQPMPDDLMMQQNML